MTDPRQYKCPASRAVALGGRTFEVRALSPLALDEARQAARQRAGDQPRSRWLQLLEVVELLVRVTGETAATLQQLYPEHLAVLLTAWQQVQADATPDLEQLSAHMRLVLLGLHDEPEFQDPDLVLDGSVAHAATGPADYYGRPAAELTLGQLAYYHTLRIAFYEVCVARAPTTKVSKRWLEQLAATARGA